MRIRPLSRPCILVASAVLAILAATPGCGRAEADAVGAVRETAPAVLFQEDETLHDVRDVLVDDAGQVWVLAGLEPFVRVYTADGTLVRSFGRSGRGPGEMMNPWSLFLTRVPSASVGVWDVGLRRLVHFSTDGASPESRGIDVLPNTVRSDIRDITYGSVDVLRGWGGGYVLQDEPGGVIHPVQILFSRLVKLDAEGRTVGVLADFRQRFRSRLGDLQGASTMVPLPLWATCADAGLVFLDPFESTLVWMDSAGRETGTTRLTLPRPTLQERDRRRYLSHVVAMELHGQQVETGYVESVVDRALRKQRKRFPETAPPAVDLLCGPLGEAWLQRFSTSDHPLGYAREWISVDRRGNSRALRFPPRFQPRFLTRDAAIGVLTDSLGVQQIARVPL